jgi:hypothetical protein
MAKHCPGASDRAGAFSFADTRATPALLTLASLPGTIIMGVSKHA